MRAHQTSRRSMMFLLLLALAAATGRAAADEALPPYFRTGILTFADRVWAQREVERVRYDRRTWPRDNPSPKPIFDQAVPAALVEARVKDALDESAAAEVYWKRAITPAMLQAELDRMVRGTKDGKALEALFAALHHDPLLIAETIARPLLADRLIHEWYAQDQRFHADARREADALAARSEASDWSRLGGTYARETYGTGESAASEPGARSVSSEEMESIERDAATWGARGHLQEGPDAFVLKRLRHAGRGRLEIETLTVAKTSFDAWWPAARVGLKSRFDEPRTDASAFRIGRVASGKSCDAAAAPGPDPVASGCDSWSHPPGFLDGTAEGRMYFTAVWTGSEMIVWGGISGRLLNSGARYDPATDTWTPTSQGANAPSVRRYHVAVWTGTEMLIWGGADAFNSFQDGSRYDPVTDQWTPMSAVGAPSARQLATAVWTGSTMIVWGGLAGASTYYNSGGRYDPSTDTWTPTSTGTNVPIARVSHTAVWTGSEMIVWGGGNSTNTNLGAGGRYDPATDTWTPHTTTGQPSARTDHSAVWTGTEMIVWGGGNNTGTYFNNGARYNPSTDTWTATTTTSAPPVRSQHYAVWTGSKMVVWGGSNGTAQFITTGGRYDPATDSWAATATANVPPGRLFARAVWTGSEMIVWGGQNSSVGGDIYKAGARYDPVGDSWVPTAIGTNMPSGRISTPGIWTGNELLVWGGASQGSSATSSGGRYEPATDAWHTMSEGANLPAGREFHTAVWTGSEMIVWGGQGSGVYQSGGRYNPASDSWQTTSLTNAPLARINHTAVWSGTQMIVWGGLNGSTTQNTGGRYDPATNLWSATNLTNAPEPRDFHAAVWTGSEMVVWGGLDGLAYLNTGGKYNPVTNAWTATSVGANVPAARANPTAIWTGSEMIVWGGNPTSTTYVNTGGRFTPGSNTWVPTSTAAGVPSARYLHTAVWTGTEMLVWGGSNGASRLNDGGHYNPTADLWNPISTAGGPPSVRFKHLAVWTGTSMAIWGGTANGNLDNNLATGGFYDFARPGSPGNTLRVNKVGSTVELTWGSIANADFYNVKRCGEPVGCTPTGIVSSPTAATYSEPIAPGDSHFYLIETANPCGVTP